MIERREGGHGVINTYKLEGVLAARNTLALTPIFFNVHRVLRMRILIRTTC